MSSKRKPNVPTFIWGPKDGGIVPAQLWFLDEIRLPVAFKDNIVVCALYVIDEQTKNYHYRGNEEIDRGDMENE